MYYLAGEWVGVEPAAVGLSAQSTQFLGKFLLLLKGDLLGAEEDNTPLSYEDGQIADQVIRVGGL